MSIKDDPRLSLLHLVLQLVLKSICVAANGLDENQKKIFVAVSLAMKKYVETTIGYEFGGASMWNYSRNVFRKALDEFKVHVIVYAMNNDNY